MKLTLLRSIAICLLLNACMADQDIEPSNGLSSYDCNSLEAITKSDSENIIKLQAYWHLYKLHKSTNHSKALNYLDSQLYLAKQDKNNKYEGLAYHGKGLMYQRIGQYVNAINSYLYAVDIFEANDNAIRMADDLLNTG